MKTTSRNNKEIFSVCMVGGDLSTNGGIASVVKTYHSANLRREVPLCITFIKTSYNKDKSKIFELYIFLMSLFKFIYLLSFRRFDLIHIHTSFAFSFLRKSIFVLVGKAFRKKIILHIHASNFYEFFLSTNFLLSYFIKFIFGISDLILVLCEDWKEKLEHRYNLRNVQVLYNPIEIDKLFFTKKERQANGLVIIFLGFLIESKGIMDILSLAKRFAANGNSGIKITVAGKGDLENFLVKEIIDNSLTGIIDFKGWVTGKTKNLLLSSGDILFLPSYKEGMPICVLEAMAKGLPIIATEIAGVPEMVKEGRNGYLFQPGDIDGYYHCFIKLQKDEKTLVAMGKESRKIVQSFDADHIFNNLVHIYQSII